MKDKKSTTLFMAVLGGIILGITASYLYINAIGIAYKDKVHNGQDNVEDKRHHDVHIEKGNGVHEDHSNAKVVKLNDGEIREFGIELGTVESGKLNTYINLPGEVVVNPDRLVHIVPRTPGIVREVKKFLGDTVSKGEIMAILESAELGQAKIEYLNLKQQLELARVDIERIRTIYDNTKKMLNMLKNSPASEILQNKTKGLDMGDNRRRLISTYTTLLLTRETYKREKNLYKKKISSQADLFEAERDYKSAQAAYSATFDEISFSIKRKLLDTVRQVSVAESALQASERRLHILGMSDNDLIKLRNAKRHYTGLSRVEIRSPFHGTVIKKHITLGEMLKDDSTAFVIADLSTVWVNLNVYQKDLPFIKNGQKVVISAGHDIPDVIGEVSWVRPMIGEDTRTSLARVVLPNSDGRLLPGLFVNGKVAIKEEDVPLVVPKSSIQTVDGLTSVFVKTEEGFEPRPVAIGRKDGNSVEIISGLTSGQEYVKKGVFTLKAQLSKRTFGDGHNH